MVIKSEFDFFEESVGEELKKKRKKSLSKALRQRLWLSKGHIFIKT
jgi:hypothetical protein